MTNIKNIIASNKKISFNYVIEKKIEAGIVLIGSEVKALRQKKANIVDSYISIDSKLNATLYNLHIGHYENSRSEDYKQSRNRRILLHKRELKQLYSKAKIKGNNIVVSKIYFDNNERVKLEIALATGKKQHDKRQSIKEREQKREVEKIFKNNR